MSSPSNPLNPTFEGHIASTIDALILFEACLSGQLNHVPRRPHDRERQDLIKSGNVFIYEEHASGIKRWTDGVSWSPSRILGNFLIYRELEKPFPPGEKKRALKKNKKPQQGVTKNENAPRMGFPSAMDPNAGGKDSERALIGSLIDSYPFKNDGLVKKTISVSYQGVPHHLVSYYNVNDVMSGRLTTPTKHHNLRNVIPRSELIMSQNFRAPIDEVECGPDDRMGGPHAMYGPLPGHEYGGHGSVLQRAMSLPTFQPVQLSGYGAPGHYGFPSHPSHQQPPPPPPHQHTFATSVAPSASPMYAPPAQSNYALHPSYYIPHRASTISNHEPAFPSPRQMREPDSLGAADEGSQHYGLEEGAWGFEGLDGTGTQLITLQQRQVASPEWPPQRML
ncbi:camp-independent regulatory protein pac2 [Dactylonectria macrodidyma]|uniref:Camp-independent regulatory protein pac2 n=1 Tax=Dactylonectria macrodidyma TaxID=307937 RepID=A0A9P9EJA0_9HYPO|nr:camp-independent regulatory protein pac2 [Dactylonectria macrodidyma]